MNRVIFSFVFGIMLVLLSMSAESREWQSMDGSAGKNILFSTIHPDNPSIMYGSTIGNGVFKSIDWGNTWFSISQDLPEGKNTYIVAMDPKNPQILYLSVVGHMDDVSGGDGVYKSKDSGQTWVPKNNGLTSVRVHNEVVIDPTDSSILYVSTEWGTDDSTIFRSSDGGENWVSISKNNGLPLGESSKVTVDPNNPTVLYVSKHHESSHDKGVYKSINSGQTWVPINNGLPDVSIPEAGINSFVVDPSDSQVMYTTTGGYFSVPGGVYKSVDGGSNWMKVMNGLSINPDTGFANNSVGWVSIHPLFTNILYLGVMGEGLYRSDDGGLNWTPDSSGITNLNVLGADFDPLNPAYMYAGTFEGSLYKSSPESITDNGDLLRMMKFHQFSGGDHAIQIYLYNETSGKYYPIKESQNDMRNFGDFSFDKTKYVHGEKTTNDAKIIIVTDLISGARTILNPSCGWDSGATIGEDDKIYFTASDGTVKKMDFNGDNIEDVASPESTYTRLSWSMSPDKKKVLIDESMMPCGIYYDCSYHRKSLIYLPTMQKFPVTEEYLGDYENTVWRPDSSSFYYVYHTFSPGGENRVQHFIMGDIACDVSKVKVKDMSQTDLGLDKIVMAGYTRSKNVYGLQKIYSGRTGKIISTDPTASNIFMTGERFGYSDRGIYIADSDGSDFRWKYNLEGDVNEDGIVDIHDAAWVIELNSGSAKAVEYIGTIDDTDCNGTPNLKDAIYILEKVSGNP